MSWRLVEGVPLPDAVGGHPALDFCNTRAGWGDPRPKEYLTAPSVLALWARENGLVPAAEADGTGREGTGREGTGREGTGREGTDREGTDREETGREETGREETGREGTGAAGLGDTSERDASERDALARALALRDALYACALHRGTPSDWELVSAEAARARFLGRLVPGHGDEPAGWQLPDGVGAAVAALAAVAAAAEDLLTSSLAAVVAACPGEGCGWLFADRRRKRRWCSMAACGNRAKARRYAERRQGTAAPPAAVPVAGSRQL